MLIILLWLILGILFFNRSPRISHVSEGLVAPAYGEIYKIEKVDADWVISIVLGLLDVHQQYYPSDGRVLQHIYDNTGRFELAYDLNKSALNEKVITVLQTNRGLVTITLIAGRAARRIVWQDRVGEKVTKGQPLGRILLGSRVDLQFPSSWRPVVRVGQKVYGPQTTLAV